MPPWAAGELPKYPMLCVVLADEGCHSALSLEVDVRRWDPSSCPRDAAWVAGPAPGTPSLNGVDDSSDPPTGPSLR